MQPVYFQRQDGVEITRVSMWPMITWQSEAKGG